MEKKYKPLSIRILYWMTEIVFWLLSVISVLAIILSISIIFGFKGNELQLHIEAPFAYDYSSEGIMKTIYGDVTIRLVDQGGRLHFVDTPGYIAKPLAGIIILVIIVIFNLVYMFRNLMKNVYEGKYFELKNVKYLRNIALWFLGLWFGAQLYSTIFYHLIRSSVIFPGIEITGQLQIHNYLLFIGLFIWILSHIFKKGLDLEETQKLTV